MTEDLVSVLDASGGLPSDHRVRSQAADADRHIHAVAVLLVVGECEDGHAVGIATGGRTPRRRVGWSHRLKRRGLVSTSKREPDKRVV